MNLIHNRNTGHSVFQRLLNLAKTNGEDFNLLLLRYGIERFLYRLSISKYVDQFILKGASLFLVWKGHNYRVTKDADLLHLGSASVESVKTLFQELCLLNTAHSDGMEFLPETIAVHPIREDQEYGGIRVTLRGMLNKAKIPIQIDIGDGDAVTPSPELIEFPALLDSPKPRLLAYPRYTVIAEKLETMLRLGIANSRMKDFYDVWLLSELFEFDGKILCKAVQNTFRRRSRMIPNGIPLVFDDEFRMDAQKLIQWRAFVRKSMPEEVSDDFNPVIKKIVTFLLPVLRAVGENKPFQKTWTPNGLWNP